MNKKRGARLERWKLNLAVLWLGNFLVMAGMTMITPFLSLYLQQDLGVIGEHEIGVWAGLIFAANFVTSFSFSRFGASCPTAMDAK